MSRRHSTPGDGAPYGMQPLEILEAGGLWDLDGATVKVYCILVAHGCGTPGDSFGESRPGTARLAHLAGVTVRAVERAIKNLKARGLITDARPAQSCQATAVRRIEWDPSKLRGIPKARRTRKGASAEKHEESPPTSLSGSPPAPPTSSSFDPRQVRRSTTDKFVQDPRQVCRPNIVENREGNIVGGTNGVLPSMDRRGKAHRAQSNCLDDPPGVVAGIPDDELERLVETVIAEDLPASFRASVQANVAAIGARAATMKRGRLRSFVVPRWLAMHPPAAAAG